MKSLNIERTKFPGLLKEMRPRSTQVTQETHFCDSIRSDNSPESTRSKEGTPNKIMNKGNVDEKYSYTKRQSNSPKNAGKRSERHSFGDFGEQNHEEATTFGRKEQSPRPTSFSENR